MATLAFTAVGNALGGPVGGAIGGLIGQTFDAQLLGERRRGPRIGDLAVQTSTYGTEIPRIYGSMRVAGSVVWATDLQESSLQTGAKGQPDTTVYSYSVSLAVALSSRPIKAIRRIWADGKLLRGAAGDFKAPVTFRLYQGWEDQLVDPLIASVEGIATTPAFRGIAYAVFEKLELAEFGNRIPFLTFEVEADSDPVEVSQVLGDVSEGAIRMQASGRQMVGYAALGHSVAAAAEPLIDAFAIDLVDDGVLLQDAAALDAVTVADEELGCTAEDISAPSVQLAQSPAADLPASLTLGYYDQTRDYQLSQMRSSAGETLGRHVSLEVPAVLEASCAKQLAEHAVTRAWAASHRLTLRLPPRFSTLQPGAVLRVSTVPGQWQVEQVAAVGLAAEVVLVPSSRNSTALPAEPGRGATALDLVQGPTTIALLELPDLGFNASGPVIHIAASSPGTGWRPVPVEVSLAGNLLATHAMSRRSILGVAKSELGAGQAFLVDTEQSLDVQLHDRDQWLESRDDEALVGGANLAVVGDELIQFGSAESLGSGKFRLSRLLRGRRGTEWAVGGHSVGEAFAMIDPAALKAVPIDAAWLGAMIAAVPRGTADGQASAVQHLVRGESCKPPSPVGLTASFASNGDLRISWVRRSRHGWAWIDGIDAPLGETAERYRVTCAGSATMFDGECSEATFLVPKAQLAGLGAGTCTISVRQIGDHALSTPASLILNLNQEIQ